MQVGGGGDRDVEKRVVLTGEAGLNAPEVHAQDLAVQSIGVLRRVLGAGHARVADADPQVIIPVDLHGAALVTRPANTIIGGS